MRSGINFEQGEIVFVPFPFTNLRSTKKRPVLVISKADYNKKSSDFVCCGITSNIKNDHYSVLIESKDLLSGFLPKSSRIKVNTIFTLEKSIVIRSFGKVEENIMKKVKEEFYKLF
ncbi:MAG: type II toxin-antitoxin system PemK/MazF family toxin [Nitrosopumilaceae archaeon]